MIVPVFWAIRVDSSKRRCPGLRNGMITVSMDTQPSLWLRDQANLPPVSGQLACRWKLCVSFRQPGLRSMGLSNDITDKWRFSPVQPGPGSIAGSWHRETATLWDLMLQKIPVTDYCYRKIKVVRNRLQKKKIRMLLYSKKQCLNYFKTLYTSIWKGTYFTLVLVQMMYSISSE